MWNPSNATVFRPIQSVLIRGVPLFQGLFNNYIYMYDMFGTARSVCITVDVLISGVSAIKLGFHCISINCLIVNFLQFTHR